MGNPLVDQVTGAAAAALEASTEEGQQKHQEELQQQQQLQDGSWKGLAAFCFGPDWWIGPDRDEQRLRLQQESGGAASINPGAGPPGKIGPSSAELDSAVDAEAAAALDASNRGISVRSTGGWNAPFPDEIPNFPTSSLSAASNQRRRGQSRHAPPRNLYEQERAMSALLEQQQRRAQEDDHEEVKLKSMPDSAFLLHEWGDLKAPASTGTTDSDAQQTGTKRKVALTDPASADANEDGRPRKKARITNAEEQKVGTTSLDKDGENDTDAEKKTSRSVNTADYVPSFYPSFPKPSDSMGRTIVDLEEEEESEDAILAKSKAAKEAAKEKELERELRSDPALKVRSALVHLGQQDSYWGSGWEAEPGPKQPKKKLAVPQGRVSGDDGAQPPIMPLGRASGSRVSRILEGSMDATKL